MTPKAMPRRVALVADDEQDWREHLAGICRRADFDVEPVGAESEVYMQLARRTFDLVVLDVQFGPRLEMNQIRPLLRAIRNAPHGGQVEVIIVTGPASRDLGLLKFGFDLLGERFHFFDKGTFAEHSTEFEDVLTKISCGSSASARSGSGQKQSQATRPILDLVILVLLGLLVSGEFALVASYFGTLTAVISTFLTLGVLIIGVAYLSLTAGVLRDTLFVKLILGVLSKFPSLDRLLESWRSGAGPGQDLSN